MTLRQLLYRFGWLFCLYSCSKDHSGTSGTGTSYGSGADTAVVQKETIRKIAIISDIHYLDPSLLTNNATAGNAFQSYLQHDPKLIEYSYPIFRSVIDELKTEKPDILLIPGDLTKDGEKISHLTLVNILNELSYLHIRIFVVPGNHDINNPAARAYDGNNSASTPTITANDFSNIYSAYGYDHAMSRDSSSLSYITAVDSALWILGIDDCEYMNNKNFPIVGGRIQTGTMQWALGWIAKAKKNHVAIYAIMHHNMIEHYTGEQQIDPGYVTDNWQQEADALMRAGLHIIFTGHYHANDITLRVTGSDSLFDVETGSLINSPVPYRIIQVKNNEMDISTKYVTTISATIPGGLDFQSYAIQFLSQHLDIYFGNVLSKPPYSLSGNAAAFDASLFRNAFMAHFAGDEMISTAEKAKDDSVGSTSPVVRVALATLWTDINTKDNNVVLRFAAP